MTASVAEKSYAATSVADVINRAHASRKTFYEQFTDEEDCYLAAYQLASDYLAARVRETADQAPTEPRDRLSRMSETYLEELGRIPLAARAFMVEIRAAGAPSQRHRRAIHDQFAQLLPHGAGIDEDPVMCTAVIAAIEELIAREITDHRTDRLPALAPQITELATRILTPTRPRPAQKRAPR